MPIPIPDQKAGSCALLALKIQVVLNHISHNNLNIIGRHTPNIKVKGT